MPPELDGNAPQSVDSEQHNPEQHNPEQQLELDLGQLPGGVGGALEAVLMVVDQALTVPELADGLKVPVQQIRDLLDGLEAQYAVQGRGFTLRCIDGGWRMYSRADYAPVVERFLMGGRYARLTQAALETLAVVAYRQPISRSRIAAVRGVNVDGVVRTLTTRGLIAQVGETAESGAGLYGTTPYFLQRIGLTSLEELPALAPYLPDSDIIEELIEQGHA